jgi:hydroxypyruvate isomerase
MSAADQRWAAVANVSLLFRELPLLDRFAAAADAGFRRVEAWWPFPVAAPQQSEVDEFVAAIEDAGVQLTGLNLFAGDMPGGERGIVNRPDRRDEFAANLQVVAGIAERTGCRGFNALYGQGVDELADQDRTAIDNLALAARTFAPWGGVLFVEALASGLNGNYPIETASDALDVVNRARQAAGSDNIAFLFDTFHLASNGEDLPAVVATAAPFIGHVQLADAPGRGEPGTGTIDFGAVFDALSAAGYNGLVALEYASTTPETALGWLSGYPQLVLGDEATA